jgi:hypothetical protein
MIYYANKEGENMRINFGDQQIEAQIQEQAEIISNHTGAKLRKLKIQFAVTGEEANEAVLAIKTSGETIAAAIANEPAKSWKVVGDSYSYREGSPIYRHAWDLQEKEDLHIEKLILNGVEFVPYAYKEAFDEDQILTITAKVSLNPDELRQIRDLMKDGGYFTVLRLGINSEGREMRFGRCLWSQHGDLVKHEIYLLDRAVDEDHKSGKILQPELNHIQRKLAILEGLSNELLSVLSEKGILTNEEIQRINNLSRERFVERLWEFEEVEDLDKW